MVDPLSYFSFQPVLNDWCNKGHGICYPVCGVVHVCMCVHVCIYVCMCVYVCMYVCMCVCVYLWVLMLLLLKKKRPFRKILSSSAETEM